MSQAYKAMLRLYPRDYRGLFGAEMAHAFERAAEERRAEGWPVFVRFALAELIGLMIGVVAEWAAKFTTDNSVRGRCLFAGAGLNLNQSSLPDEVVEAQRRITFLVSRIVHAIANHDFPGARSYSYEESKERESLRLLREKYKIDE